MCEKRPKRERVCRALSALSDLSLSLSLSANACCYVSERDARAVYVCVCIYSPKRRGGEERVFCERVSF